MRSRRPWQWTVSRRCELWRAPQGSVATWAAGARFGVDVAAFARAAEDAAGAYDALARLLDAAIDDVDKRGD
jgi:hypothetical protein